jgi:Bacterial Ig domain
MPSTHTLTIQYPANNQQLPLNQPFQVTGLATDKGMPEPVAIESVTVQVDGGPVTNATLKRIPNKQMTEVSFKASVEITASQDTHTISVTVTNDQGQTLTKQITVFTVRPFVASPPAVLVDIISPFPLDTPQLQPILNSWTSQIQQQLTTLSNTLVAAGKLLAGPNFFFTTDSRGIKVMRVGFWIENSTFPVLPPSPPDFPLPRLSDQGAQAGFNLTPVLSVPDPSGLSPSFALSIPARTLQSLADTALPSLQAMANGQGVELDSINVSTAAPGSVTTTFSGSKFDVGFSVTITEKLGLVPVSYGFSDDPESIPAVVGSNDSASVGDLLDWVLGTLFPLFGLALLGALDIANDAADQAAGQATGIAKAVIASIPSNIPFRNSLLSLPGLSLPDFPALVLDWQTFGATTSAIVGSGTSTIEARNQSIASVDLLGGGLITEYQAEAFGGDAGQTDSYALRNIAPDQNKFVWQSSGVGPATIATNGVIDVAPLTQSGNFGAIFRMKRPVAVGDFYFNLNVNATETCGTDPSKTLTASRSRPVHVRVLKNPKVLP